MRSVALGAALAGAMLVLAGPAGTLPSSPGHDVARSAAPAVAPVSAHTVSSSPAASPAALTDVVRQYCVVCHNDPMMTGNLSLQAFDVEKAGEKPETAERMIRKLRAAMMPPPGAPRPGGDTLLQLVETLESKVDAAAKAAPNVGDRRFQRLSRIEYERAVHDLLDLDVDAGKWLPPDFYSNGFDNQASAQPFSATLLDSFLRAASEVARAAIGNPDAVASTVKYVNPDRVSQHAWDHLDGTPFGTRGGIVVTHDFPADGQYVFQVLTDRGTGTETPMEDIDISIDGESVAVLKLEWNGGKLLKSTIGAGGSGFDAAQTGGIQTEPVFVKAGQHKVSAAFVNLIDGPYEDRFKPAGWSSAGNAFGEYGSTGLTHAKELWVTGPAQVAGVSETASRKRIFSCHPAAAEQQRACAESILSRLSTQAYRRPGSQEDVAELLRFYDEGAPQGFEVGVRNALQAILLSPEFVFRLERAPAGAQPGQTGRLNDVELASRISFFLWDAAPDQELLELAAKGQLSKPNVLEQQVRRMLKDPKGRALSTRFAHQWLMLQDVAKVWPQAYLYPDFTAQIAQDMVEETELFFQHLVDDDRSFLELFSADYTFLNERLANHYGIAGVAGDEWRLVQYPADSHRKGVLSHGSLLQLTSVSDRTSPVLRGKYVMSVLMGTPPPPPPPNVPTLDQTAAGSGGRRLTTRERMEMHRKNPVCTSCHNFIDPIGLALDNFDVGGRWRIRENMAALDTRGTFYDGTPISSPTELANVLLKRPVPLVRTFTGNLLSYAIGRPVEYYDQPAVRAIVRGAEAKNYDMVSLIMGVVKSDAFQMKQAQTTTSSY